MPASITYLAEVAAVDGPAHPCLRNALAACRTRHHRSPSHSTRYPIHKVGTGSEIRKYSSFKLIVNRAGKRAAGITPTPVLPRVYIASGTSSGSQAWIEKLAEP